MVPGAGGLHYESFSLGYASASAFIAMVRRSVDMAPRRFFISQGASSDPARDSITPA